MKAFQEEGLGGSEEDDEDLMNDPITQIDIQVSTRSRCTEVTKGRLEC